MYTKDSLLQSSFWNLLKVDIIYLIDNSLLIPSSLSGFQLYVMLIEVFEAEKSRLRWYYLVAYGAPLLIVAISGFIDPFSYGTDRYCWLRADNYFIFSFVGPVVLVILVSYSLFVLQERRVFFF